MPGQLRTIPLAIAAVGMTVDGREITDKDIDDIVETYNYKKYGARINIDHEGEWSGWGAKFLYNVELNGGMLGDVLEVSQGVNDEGVKVLYAVLAPNASFVTLNQADQAVYFSIEIDRDFIESGTTYLTGLAVTDYPASTYTQRAKFNKTSPCIESFKVELTQEQSQEPSPKRSLFKGLFNFKKEETEMKKEDFASALTEALSEPLQKMNDAITANTQALTALKASGTEGGADDKGEDDDSTPPETAIFSKEQQAAFDKINSSVIALSTQLQKALKTPKFSTTPGEEEHLGDEAELGDLL
ncbi:GPO family capsid scaffolding protein [uncultured Shewanella sp.]|uniref:GPO family capsid scaffolding protein n=1 Tax=uncultured Shewanella sp. TaxID=173975 RepID=UPI0026293DA9|nr:GPO family capsid scaffolding protein [uncultured Shewanella sp.]